MDPEPLLPVSAGLPDPEPLLPPPSQHDLGHSHVQLSDFEVGVGFDSFGRPGLRAENGQNLAPVLRKLGTEERHVFQ